MTRGANRGDSGDAGPLYFGNWGGLPSKLLWFVFGAILSALSVTGTLICALRVAAPGKRVRGVVRRWASA